MNDASIARPRRHFLFALLIVGLGLLAYSSSFRGVFVLDDNRAIVENPRVRHVLPRPGELVARRSFARFTFALNYATGGLNPADYHLTNLVIHLAAVLVLFGLLRRTLERPRAGSATRGRACELAALAAGLWGVHPLTTGAVTYISQRYESLMSLFYLLVLYGLVRGSTSKRAWPWYGVSVVASILGMATKEVMVTAPIAVLLYDRLLLCGSWREMVRRRWGLYAGLAVSWGWLFLLMRTGVEPTAAGDVYGAFPAWGYLVGQGRVILHYLRLCLWPHPLLLDYGADLGGPGPIVSFAGVAAVAVASVLAVRRAPAAAFAGLLFFVLLAPTSSIVARPDPVFEHRMYLPLACVVAVLVVGAWTLARRMGAEARAGRGLAAVCVVLIVACASATYARNLDYTSEATLWQQVARRFPHHPRAGLNLASHALKNGRPEESVRLIETFLSRLPSGGAKPYDAIRSLEPRDRVAFGRAQNTLGLAYLQMDRAQKAIMHFRLAVAATPGNSRGRSNLGVALFEAGQTEEAVVELKLALKQDPHAVATHQSLAEAYRTLGEADAAARHYRAILMLEPGHALARRRLGGE